MTPRTVVERAVARRPHAAARAERQGAVHVAGRVRLGADQIVVGVDAVAVGVVLAGGSGHHAGNAAATRPRETHCRGGLGEDGAVLRAAGGGVHGLHQRGPQRRGGVAAGGVAGQGLVVVRADPHGGGIVGAHAREGDADVVGVGAGLAGDLHAAEVGLRAGAHAGGDAALEHVHQHPGRGFLEHLALESAPGQCRCRWSRPSSRCA